jgi:predicted AAA+ superfamily ATPase
MTDNFARMEAILERIARALEKPPGETLPDQTPQISAFDGFVWEPSLLRLVPVGEIPALPLNLLKGIDNAREILVENTRRFAAGLPANNALLWGARGMGKSSLVKAVHGQVNRQLPPEHRIAMIEIHREDIDSLPMLLRQLRGYDRRFLLLCDDLSFDREDTSYKSLKAALEGGIEGRPANVLFYATSNRRHMMPRDMMENERSTAINPSEAVEEKVSLSDRFGLWLGFHHCGQDEYLAMVFAYVDHFALQLGRENLRERAIAWAAGRGARSGRVAWQFIQDLAGELGHPLK